MTVMDMCLATPLEELANSINIVCLSNGLHQCKEHEEHILISAHLFRAFRTRLPKPSSEKNGGFQM